MKILTRHLLFPVAGLAILLSHHSALAQTTYTQTVVGTFANSTNLVEKSATAAPNDAITFSNAVKAAYATNYGGVFDFPTAVATGTTVYRGTYAGGGTVWVDDFSITTLDDTAAHIHVPAYRRRIGYVFQDARLFPHLDVRQNLDYGRRMNRLADDPAARAREHFERAVALSKETDASPLVALAEAVTIQKQDVKAFESLLNRALAINPDANPDLRLVNTVMQRRARWLLSRESELFLTESK